MLLTFLLYFINFLGFSLKNVMAYRGSPYVCTCALIVLHGQYQPYNTFTVRPILKQSVPETQNFKKFDINGIVGVGLLFWHSGNTG
jgi:hypothetical protein